ncbi:MAG: hypothetical protein ACXVBK_13205 [Flavisolibacter sp.]
MKRLKEVAPVESMYDDIKRFIQEYFPAYSQYGQVAETHRIMDKFYDPEVSFDDGMVTGRDQWYEMCLAHPAIQDKLTVEHLFIDEKQKEVGALLKAQAIDRATGGVQLELKMNVLYNIRIDQKKDMKITKVRVFLESNPSKVAKLFQLYAAGP